MSSLLRTLPPPADVLVAEDTGIHGELAQFLLEAEGYHVDVVPDGRAALIAFRQHRYALVLLDCRMPTMDGYGAARAMRRLERERGTATPTPIVAITVYLDDVSRDRCMRSGMTACLRKPLDLGVLSDALVDASLQRTAA